MKSNQERLAKLKVIVSQSRWQLVNFLKAAKRAKLRGCSPENFSSERICGTNLANLPYLGFCLLALPPLYAGRDFCTERALLPSVPGTAGPRQLLLFCGSRPYNRSNDLVAVMRIARAFFLVQRHSRASLRSSRAGRTPASFPKCNGPRRAVSARDRAARVRGTSSGSPTL